MIRAKNVKALSFDQNPSIIYLVPNYSSLFSVGTLFHKKAKNERKEMFLKLFLLSFLINLASTSIWIDNMRSKDETAVLSGRKCLSKISKYFFRNPEITRTRNLAIFHSGNLTRPASDIESEFLLWLHRAIAFGKFEE